MDSLHHLVLASTSPGYLKIGDRSDKAGKMYASEEIKRGSQPTSKPPNGFSNADSLACLVTFLTQPFVNSVLLMAAVEHFTDQIWKLLTDGDDF